MDDVDAKYMGRKGLEKEKKEEKKQSPRDALKESLSGFDSSLDRCPRSLGW